MSITLLINPMCLVPSKGLCCVKVNNMSNNIPFMENPIYSNIPKGTPLVVPEILVKSYSESGTIFKVKLPQGFAAPNSVLGRAWRGPWRGSQKIPFTGGSLYMF